MAGEIALGLDPVIVSVVDEQPLVLTVVDGAYPRLPAGSFDPARDRTLEVAARRSIDHQVGVDVGYLEQLYTFGDRYRDPARNRRWSALCDRRLPRAHRRTGSGALGRC